MIQPSHTVRDINTRRLAAAEKPRDVACYLGMSLSIHRHKMLTVSLCNKYAHCLNKFPTELYPFSTHEDYANFYSVDSFINATSL